MYWHAIPLSGNILKTFYGMHMKNITLQTYVRKLVAKEVTLLAANSAFRNLKVLTVYSLYIQETILHVKKGVTA
jgi:hypothetical protein